MRTNDYEEKHYFKMVSKILIALCVVVAVASALPAAGGAGGWAAGPAAGGWGAGPGANPFIPPWVSSSPWFPVWTPCAAIGSSCVDCNTKLVCTKIGGLQRACTDPTLPYCNLGACSATPTAECAPVVAVPATV